MSGVYIYEIVPRDRRLPSLIKIGSTRHCLEKRIEDSFNTQFNRDQYSYYPIELIPSNISVAVNLENFLINKFIDIVNVPPCEGREFFCCDNKGAEGYLKKLPELVLDFYSSNNNYIGFEKSIGCFIKFKRRKMGITQCELSEMSGLRQATISEFENGKVGAYSTLRKLAGCLDIKIALLNI